MRTIGWTIYDNKEPSSRATLFPDLRQISCRDLPPLSWCVCRKSARMAVSRQRSCGPSGRLITRWHRFGALSVLGQFGVRHHIHKGSCSLAGKLLCSIQSGLQGSASMSSCAHFECCENVSALRSVNHRREAGGAPMEGELRPEAALVHQPWFSRPLVCFAAPRAIDGQLSKPAHNVPHAVSATIHAVPAAW